jgi:hypothetical protein
MMRGAIGVGTGFLLAKRPWKLIIHGSLYLKMPALNESIQNLVRTYETDY